MAILNMEIHTHQRKGLMKLPLSIITVNYNNVEGLKDTVTSVLDQDVDVEYIIIDGGSTDGSEQVVDRLSSQCSVAISEPDNGIYHAMNKGVGYATREYCLFMNSGDCLASGVLEQIEWGVLDSDFVLFNYFDRTSQCIVPQAESPLSLLYLFRSAPKHQAMLIRTGLLVVTPYNEKLKILADWELLFSQWIFSNPTVTYVPILFAETDEEGISAKQKDQLNSERRAVLESKLSVAVLQELDSLNNELLVSRSRVISKFIRIYTWLKNTFANDSRG